MTENQLKFQFTDNVLDQLINQFTKWDEILAMKDITGKTYAISWKVKTLVISCREHEEQRRFGNHSIDFEWFWIGKHLEEIKFEKYMELVRKCIPFQDVQIEKMRSLFNSLLPIVHAVREYERSIAIIAE